MPFFSPPFYPRRDIVRWVWNDYRKDRDKYILWYWDFRLMMRRAARNYALARGWPVPFSFPRPWLFKGVR